MMHLDAICWLSDGCVFVGTADVTRGSDNASRYPCTCRDMYNSLSTSVSGSVVDGAWKEHMAHETSTRQLHVISVHFMN